MIWASRKARRGRMWRGWRLTRCRDNSQTPHQPHPTNIPPPTPPFHLSRVRSLQRRQEGDQGERASRHSWEGRWAISLSRLARVGLMCGTITKRRSAWHEQCHVHTSSIQGGANVAVDMNKRFGISNSPPPPRTLLSFHLSRARSLQRRQEGD